MRRVVSSGVWVLLSRVPQGAQGTARPSARGMKTAAHTIAPDAHATVPAPCPKRPQGWAPSSAAAPNTGARAPGTRVTDVAAVLVHQAIQPPGLCATWAREAWAAVAVPWGGGARSPRLPDAC
jgi:hypothetical protein